MKRRSKYYGVVWNERSNCWQGQIVVNGKVSTIASEKTEEWQMAAEVQDYVASLKEQGKIVSDTFGKLKMPSQFRGITWNKKRGEFMGIVRWEDGKLAFSIFGDNQFVMASKLRQKVKDCVSSGHRSLSTASLLAGKKKPKEEADLSDSESDTVDGVFSGNELSLDSDEDMSIQSEDKAFDIPPCRGIYPSKTGSGFDCRVFSDGCVRHLCVNERPGRCYVELMEELWRLSCKRKKYDPTYGLPFKNNVFDHTDRFAFNSADIPKLGPAEVTFQDDDGTYYSEFYSDQGLPTELRHVVISKSEKECMKIIEAARSMLITKSKKPIIRSMPQQKETAVQIASNVEYEIAESPEISEKEAPQPSEPEISLSEDKDAFEFIPNESISSEESYDTELNQAPKKPSPKNTPPLSPRSIPLKQHQLLMKQNKEFRKKLPWKTNISWIGKELWVKWDGDREWYRGIVVDLIDSKTFTIRYPVDGTDDIIHIRKRKWHWVHAADESSESEYEDDADSEREEELSSSEEEVPKAVKENDVSKRIGCHWVNSRNKYQVVRMHNRRRNHGGTFTDLQKARIASDELYIQLTSPKDIELEKLNFPDDLNKYLKKFGKSSRSEPAPMPKLASSTESEKATESYSGTDEFQAPQRTFGVTNWNGKWRVRRQEQSTGKVRYAGARSNMIEACLASDALYIKFNKNPNPEKMNFPQNFPTDWTYQHGLSKSTFGVTYQKDTDMFHVKRRINGKYVNGGRFKTTREACLKSDEIYHKAKNVDPEKLNFPDLIPVKEATPPSEPITREDPIPNSSWNVCTGWTSESNSTDSVTNNITLGLAFSKVSYVLASMKNYFKFVSVERCVL